jgi:SAM-dependent methyltransferase
MGFNVSAGAYGRFMGRFSEPLAAQFVELAHPEAGRRALDVGCGPGGLTAQLVQRLGVDAVSAVDPSAPFVAAVHARLPGVDVHQASAELLPFADDVFDYALAQLVVHFMADPVAGLREMGRVTAPGGVVAASVWDHGSDGGPLSAYWRVVRDLDPTAPDESRLPGSAGGQLHALAEAAGLADVVETSLAVEVDHPGFEEWWEPFTLGVGPAGHYVAGLSDQAREKLRARCREVLPDGAFTVRASAWVVIGSAPAHPRSRGCRSR